MRIAAYTRYSSDMQRAASLADQLRNCRSWCARQGWEIDQTYSDQAISGARSDRPQYIRMITDAEAGQYDLILVDDLSRLSRDQLDLGRTVRMLSHWGVRLIGVSDGVDTARKGHKLEVGLRGIMAEAYLDDLAEKTHRGLTGQALKGYSAGGLPYGYRSIRDNAGDGYTRIINPAEADVVRRIFARFSEGASCRTIAAELNADGIPAPRGRHWAQSAIYGDMRRGLGILANPIYAGEQIWNRSQWVKHPITGRRQRRERPQSEWIIHHNDALRIIDQDLWDACRRRIGATHARSIQAREQHGQHARAGARPTYLLSGLLRCGQCGGPMVIVGGNPKRYGCAHRKDSGACTMHHTVARHDAEREILAAVQSDLLSEQAYRIFASEARLAIAAISGDTTTAHRAVDQAQRERDNIMTAIRAGIITPSTRQALIDAETEIERRQGQLTHIRSLSPDRIFPRARDLWIESVSQLTEIRDTETAREHLRAIIGPIKIRPEGGYLIAEMSAGAALLSTIGVVAGGRSVTNRTYTEDTIEVRLRALHDTHDDPTGQ